MKKEVLPPLINSCVYRLLTTKGALPVGAVEGTSEGAMDGGADGYAVIVGCGDGGIEGRGDAEGEPDGIELMEGADDGMKEAVGAGVLVGPADGTLEGRNEGGFEAVGLEEIDGAFVCPSAYDSRCESCRWRSWSW